MYINLILYKQMLIVEIQVRIDNQDNKNICNINFMIKKIEDKEILFKRMFINNFKIHKIRYNNE